MKSFIVIGLGRFGSSVAEELYKLGHEVLAVDRIEEYVNHVADNVTHAITCDARDEATLKSLGVGNFDCAIVGIGSDIASSVMITVTLKELGASQVICKANSEIHKKVLQKVGADRVIFPEYEMARKLAQTLSATSVLDFIELSENFGIAEIAVPRIWVGKTIGELDVRAKFGVNVIAVKEGADISVSPGAQYVLLHSSVLVLVGKYSDIEAVQAL